jgi:tetratricopeptide (TPR) repeat protein
MKTYICLLSLLVAGNAFCQVNVYKQKDVIPTYKLGPNEKSPLFYKPRDIQLARGHYYPYPAQTDIARERTEDVAHEMIYLENEYIKISIYPAFGGKLQTAVDKTNGYEMFHLNTSIKPALIGTLGAWVSGGIEWCFPDHHRTTTMLPSDYFIQKHDNGSITVWTGETERKRRLKGNVGITLYPGSSLIHVDYRISHTSPMTETFLFWANASMEANQDYRVFWPPSQEIGVFHKNNDVTQWPVSHEQYKQSDYSAGVDMTWWKNHPSPISFFMWHPGKDENFVGGYDYGKRAGTIHVGEVFENQSSKLWEWGPSAEGARKMLTDDGKAYVELMTGSFSNSQPDYSFIAPHSVKDAKNYYYPIRDLEVVKDATEQAATTLLLRDPNTVFYGFNTTRSFKRAKTILTYQGKTVAEEIIDIDPATPYTRTWKSRVKLDEYQLCVELQDHKADTIISYRPYKLKHPPLPQPDTEPKKPDELDTVEELYLVGRYVEQYHHPFLDPEAYYNAALAKSPDDYRVNIAMGMRRVKQWRYQEAEEYLQRAGERLRILYYHPRESELYYYLALAQLHQGKTDEAYHNFFRATWYYEWYSASYFQLAQMESQRGNVTKALEYIKNAYSTNNYDNKIVVLYSALLRRAGKIAEAKDIVAKQLAYDPLNFPVFYERNLLHGKPSMKQWQANMQDPDNNYLEIASSYFNAGLNKEAVDLLSELEDSRSPLVYYYLAWFCAQRGDKARAAASLDKAAAQSIDYCFPYRFETEAVLNHAITMNPGDATAHYLLGNLLYDNRPAESVAHWQKATGLKQDFAMAWRNLAWGAFHLKKDGSQALKDLRKALSVDPANARWFGEFEAYFNESDADYREYLAMLEENIDVVRKDIDAAKTLAKMYNLDKNYDQAIAYLKETQFRSWENERLIYWYYVDAYQLRALKKLKHGQYQSAILDLELAMQHPDNLGVGKPFNDERNAMLYYTMGQAYARQGNDTRARECYQNSVQAKNDGGWKDLEYYQGLSYSELGQEGKARAMFAGVEKHGDSLIKREHDKKEARQKNRDKLVRGYYLKALANRAMDQHQEAMELLLQARTLNRNDLWVNYFYENP